MVERGLIAFQRVRGAEKMPAGADIADSVQAEARFVDLQRLQKRSHALKEFEIDHELLEGCGQAAFHPSGGMHHQIGVPEHNRPERHHAFPGCLRIHRVRGVGIGRAVGQPVLAGELAADESSLGIFRSSEGGSAAAHIHIRREAAIDHRRAGADHLGEGNDREGLRVLLGEGAGNGHRAHRAGEGKGGDADGLAVVGHFHQALQHRDVDPERGGGVDDGMHSGPVGDAVTGLATGDTQHVDGIARPLPPERIGVMHLVGQGQEGIVAIQMPGLRRQIHRFDRIAAKQMDDVRGLAHTDEILEIGIVAVPAAAFEITAEGGAGNAREVEVVAAKDKIPLGAPAMEGEFRRSLGNIFEHHVRLEADALGAFCDIGTMLLQNVACGRVQEINADVAQDTERGSVDRFQFIL